MKTSGRKVLDGLRIAAAAALVLVAGDVWRSCREPGELWPPAGRRLAARARSACPAEAARLAAGWRQELERERLPLEGLAAALAAEGRARPRRALAERALAHLDSARLEAELRDLARLSPAARRLEYPRRIGPLVAGTPADAAALGEALAELAAAREAARARLPAGCPPVTDAFRKDLLGWLSASSAARKGRK